jgi:uncharacterized protein (DUF1778 family)
MARRTRYLTVRTEPEERAIVALAAQFAGLCLSDFVRLAVMREARRSLERAKFTRKKPTAADRLAATPSSARTS